MGDTLGVHRGILHVFHDGTGHHFFDALVDAVGHIAVEAVEGLSNVGHGNDIVPLAITYDGGGSRAGQGHEFVLVQGNLAFRAPVEVLGLHGVGVDGEFPTGVTDGTVVTPRGSQGGRTVTAGTHVRGQLERHEHVLGGLVVPFHHKIQAVVEEIQVQTHVELFLLLPHHVGVGHVGLTIAGTQAGGHLGHGRAPLVGANAGVTGLSPAETEFTVVQDLLGIVGEEFLVGEAPCYCHGVERSPAFVGTKVRGTIVTERVGSDVTVVVVVGFTGEEGSHGAVAETEADGGGTGTQVRVHHIVGREGGIEHAHVVPLAGPYFLAHHGGDAVLAEGVAVGEVVLEGPVDGVVLLFADFVGGALVGAQAHRGVEGLGGAVGQVIVQFCVPGQVLEERKGKV